MTEQLPFPKIDVFELLDKEIAYFRTCKNLN